MPKSARIIISLFAGFIVFTAIVFFLLIAPYRTIPILMYHSITHKQQEGSIVSLKKDIFIKQMEYLEKHNYRVVSLKTAVSMFKEGRSIPDNYVVLTFDDGYRDFYTQAYPVIKGHKFNVTVFVYLDMIEKNPHNLTWEQLNLLEGEDLVEIGSHSISHRPLVFLALEEAESEILNSKLRLEEKLKKPVMFFSYPFGALNDSIKRIVKDNKYDAAVGIAYRRGDFPHNDIYILKRVFVSESSKYPFVFRFMLSGYYVPVRELILGILNIKTPRDVRMQNSADY